MNAFGVFSIPSANCSRYFSFPAFNHSAHFASETQASASMRELDRDIATQLSTFPLGSSAAGFTYTFDPALGVYNRTAETFGPVFSFYVVE